MITTATIRTYRVPVLLDVLEARLDAAGARPAANGARAGSAERFRDRPLPTQRGEPVGGRLIGEYLAAQRDALVANDPGARAGDSDAVHDLRIAVRRLRCTLRAFRPLLRSETTEPLRAELGWLGRRLGAVRDADVMSANLAAAIDAVDPELIVGPVADRIGRRVARGAEKARSRLLRALASQRYAGLLDRLDQLVAEPRAISYQQATACAAKALRRADRKLDAALRHPPRAPVAAAASGETALHEARKAYKRARYALEVVLPAAGHPARRLVRRLRVMQDLLGDLHDAWLTADLLRDHGMRAHLAGENAFSYGILVADRNAAARDLLARLPRARRRLRKPRLRHWLER
ncbi:CHAD domain-containing protein [Actinocatenispora thailandica]|nr:CHAD domain-containing protein [Actinocatenispora thailandica]